MFTATYPSGPATGEALKSIPPENIWLQVTGLSEFSISVCQFLAIPKLAFVPAAGEAPKYKKLKISKLALLVPAAGEALKYKQLKILKLASTSRPTASEALRYKCIETGLCPPPL